MLEKTQTQKIVWYRKIHRLAYEVIACPACGKKLEEYCIHDVMEEVRQRVDDLGIPLDFAEEEK